MNDNDFVDHVDFHTISGRTRYGLSDRKCFHISNSLLDIYLG